jgi:hypothetical protein
MSTSLSTFVPAATVSVSSVRTSRPARSRRVLLLLSLLASLTMGTQLAAAQTRLSTTDAGAELTSTSTSVKATGGQALITYKQKTSYDFDDDQVEGSVLQPDGDIVSGRGKSHHESLVKARTTFIPEMFKSAENL